MVTQLRTVAIAGVSGNLGYIVAKTFLLPRFRTRFQDVVLLARAPSEKTQKLVDGGAKLRIYDDEDLAAAFDDVDVFVNAIGPSGHEFKNRLLKALSKSPKLKLYFPSEFGVDHYIHDFPHEEWDAKKHHFKLGSELSPKIFVCRVFAGLFLEDSIGPWFGFNTKDGQYEAVGNTMQLCSFTSKTDLAKALAILSSYAAKHLQPKVHLNGDAKSVYDIADIMKKAGGGSIEVTSLPLEQYKEEVLAKPTPTPERYLRFLIGEGKINHTFGVRGQGCDNNLVEDDYDFGAWRSVQDLAATTKGKPWADATWPLSKV